MSTRSFIFLSGKLLYFFPGLCDYSDKFPKMFCRSCGMECPSTANFCHQCGQQLNLNQVSNKAVSSVDKEKLLKKYFHRGYPYAVLIMCTSGCGIGSILKSLFWIKQMQGSVRVKINEYVHAWCEFLFVSLLVIFNFFTQINHFCYFSFLHGLQDVENHCAHLRDIELKTGRKISYLRFPHVLFSI